MSGIRDLLEQRARTVAGMREITDHPEGDGGDLSDDQVRAFDGLKGELVKHEKAIERQAVLDEAERRMNGTPLTDGAGDFDAECRQFSIVRAIASQVPDIAGSVDAGREREISSELHRRSGRPSEGIAIPMAVFQRPVEQRTQLLGTATAGGFLNAGQFRPDLFVDLLRARLITGRLGATVLNGLNGAVSIPTRTASTTAQWVGENVAIDLSDQAFGQLQLTEKIIGARTEVTRSLLLQSSPSIEDLVRQDMAAVLATAVDTAAINGSGLGAEPQGLLKTPGIGTFNLATVSWANLIAAIEDIETANTSATGWLTNPHTAAKLMSTVKISGDTTGNFIMGEPASLAGYPLVSSTIMPTTLSGGAKSGLVLGDWSDMLVGYWDQFSILINPYAESSYAKAAVQLRALLSCDVTVRHPASFTAATDIT